MIVALTTFTAFLIVILYDLGLPRSISKSYYLWNKDHKFVVGTLAYGIPLLFVDALEMKIAGIMIIIVAASPAGRQKGLEGFLHVFGAVGAIAIGVVYFFLLGFDNWLYWVMDGLFISFVIFATQLPIKKHTAIIEIVAVYMFVTGAKLAEIPTFI